MLDEFCKNVNNLLHYLYYDVWFFPPQVKIISWMNIFPPEQLKIASMMELFSLSTVTAWCLSVGVQKSSLIGPPPSLPQKTCCASDSWLVDTVHRIFHAPSLRRPPCRFTLGFSFDSCELVGHFSLVHKIRWKPPPSGSQVWVSLISYHNCLPLPSITSFHSHLAGWQNPFPQGRLINVIIHWHSVMAV